MLTEFLSQQLQFKPADGSQGALALNRQLYLLLKLKKVMYPLIFLQMLFLLLMVKFF